VDETSRGNGYFKVLSDVAEKRLPPQWLERDLKNLSGRVLRMPERAEIDGNLNEQLIVEYYSR
jgi:small subunit ribosomal protein S4